MKRIYIFFVTIAVLAGCSMLRKNQEAAAYQAVMASNQTEYENGQILLSEKLRRDYLAGVQYKQINRIEASCTQLYMNLAKAVENGKLSEQRFNDKRDRLEMACQKAYSTNDYMPVSSWITGDVYSSGK